MAEYIEREAALHATERLKALMVGDKRVSVDAMKSFIENRPAADVVPVVHGRWKTNSDRPDSLICSICKCGFDMWKHDPHNYCPNCGARMDGGISDAKSV